MDPIKHTGDLLTRAGELEPPIKRFELCEALSVRDPKEIKDLEAAWVMAQELSTQKAGEQSAAKAAAESAKLT